MEKRMLINLPIAIARLFVGIAVCATIFTFSLTAGLLQLPRDVWHYASKESRIAFRGFYVNYPAFRKPPKTEEGKFVDLAVKKTASKPGAIK